MRRYNSGIAASARLAMTPPGRRSLWPELFRTPLAGLQVRRPLLGIGLVVVAVVDGCEATRDGWHDPAPVGGAAPAGPLLLGHVGEEPLRLGVVVGHGDA